jgi:hypothetical protein
MMTKETEKEVGSNRIRSRRVIRGETSQEKTDKDVEADKRKEREMQILEKQTKILLHGIGIKRSKYLTKIALINRKTTLVQVDKELLTDSFPETVQTIQNQSRM